jgi:hypothetical protein
LSLATKVTKKATGAYKLLMNLLLKTGSLAELIDSLPLAGYLFQTILSDQVRLFSTISTQEFVEPGEGYKLTRGEYRLDSMLFS